MHMLKKIKQKKHNLRYQKYLDFKVLQFDVMDYKNK